MLDHFSIFTKGGIVLWAYNQVKLKGNPLDILIRNVILEVVYQKILSLLYIEELLKAVERKFIETFGDKIKNSLNEFDFTDLFVELLDAIESRSAKEARRPQSKKPAKKLEQSTEELVSSSDELTTSQPEPSLSSSQDSVQQNIERMRQKLESKNKPKPKVTPAPTSPVVKPKRGDRKWDDVINNQEKADLDYSKKIDKSSDNNNSDNEEKVDILATKIELDNWAHEQDSDDEIDDSELQNGSSSSKNQKATPTIGGRFFSMLQNLSGNKPLDAEDLAPGLVSFREHLISKNVASDIAEKLCDSVSASLLGKKLGTFGSVKNTIRSSLEESLVRILTPKKSIDILRDAQEARENGKVYTIVFCGVNGVGKSTNLAKVCAFLLQNGFTPMIAACDTFRSAAVEQLAVHCRRLNVELFEKGYRTDPASIAQEAVRTAKSKGKDVVLIDTTGRMQDNLPLMQALAKLVNSVKPDLVLFVGEALVGHDAVDQLVKFNQCLVDLSKDKEPRKIDGIILTKFDTIDDKVGAAISMVYTTGQPIVFVGVGQHYTDLKRLNIQAVTKALLKGA